MADPSTTLGAWGVPIAVMGGAFRARQGRVDGVPVALDQEGMDAVLGIAVAGLVVEAGGVGLVLAKEQGLGALEAEAHVGQLGMLRQDLLR